MTGGDLPEAGMLADTLRRLNHDVRTPLVLIDGFARLLADARPLRDEDRMEFGRRIRAAAVELRQLVEEARDTVTAHAAMTAAAEPLVHETRLAEPDGSGFVAVVEEQPEAEEAQAATADSPGRPPKNAPPPSTRS